MSSVILILWFALFSSAQISPMVNPNSVMDIHSLNSHVLNLEKSLSDMKSETETQNRKYAALLSSVLSKLTTTADELNAVKMNLRTLETDHKGVKDELVMVKVQLKSTQDELKIVLDTTHKNVTSCLLELKSVKNTLNVSTSKLTGVETDVKDIKEDIRFFEANVSKLNSYMDAGNSLNWNLTAVLSEVINLKARENISESNLMSTLKAITLDQQSLRTELNITQQNVKVIVDSLPGSQQVVNVSSCRCSSTGADTKIKVVAFSAALDHSKLFSEGETVIFNHVITDVANAYSNNTGVFTCPQTGIYIFHFHALSHKDNHIYLQLQHNKQYMTSAYGYTPSDYGEAGNSVILMVNKGDTVEIVFSGNTSSSLYGDDKQYATFSGFLLSRI